MIPTHPSKHVLQTTRLHIFKPFDRYIDQEARGVMGFPKKQDLAHGFSDQQSALLNSCQLITIPHMAEEPIYSIEELWQFKNRIKRYIKRRNNYLIRWIKKHTSKTKENSFDGSASNIDYLNSGDLVVVKSKENIEKTLDNWGRLKGCGFMEEMWLYCGTSHRVLKRVNKFLDERDYRIKKCTHIVLLEGVNCWGTRDFGVCDRNCFFFWREEWLEKRNNQ
jgi:hypothetical protein